MIKEINDKLLELTEEEIKILNGENSVNKSIYTDNKKFIIDSNKLLAQGELIDIRKHTRFINFPSHNHNYIEFNYVYKGKLIQIIDNKRITLQKGELIVLNKYITHEIKASSEDDIIINFIIRPEFFAFLMTLLENENIISKFLLTILYNIDYGEGEYLYFKVSEKKDIQDLLEKIIIELYNTSMMGKAKIKLLVGLLLVELANNPQDIETYSVDNYEKMLIIKSLKYIDEYYKTATLFQLAKELKQPDYKLSKLIKKHTGMNFKDLLQNKRLNKCIDLLKVGKLSIVDIIEIIGYKNPTYFYKIFKEKYKVTPREYRKKYDINFPIANKDNKLNK